MDNQKFRELLVENWRELPDGTRESVVKFRQLVLQENEIQNLTRLTSPESFYEGHIVDVRELLKMKELSYPAMDLGSGLGVPGLLSALIRPDSWILCESEKHKANFLERAVNELNIGNHVRVVSDRGESFLLREAAPTVVCRAVGSVERILGWIGKCSTWNTLILFKGPKWAEEWSSLQKTKWARGLQVRVHQNYKLPFSGAERVIVQLDRVPRGTTSK